MTYITLNYTEEFYMKSLKTIQTLSKIGKVLSKIIFILSIVSFCLCLVGIISVAIGGEVLKLNGVTIKGIIPDDIEINEGTMYAAMAVAMIVCAGEAVLSKFAEVYFKNELSAGTPFTLSGAKELMRLGILSICIPIGADIISAIAYEVINTAYGNINDFEISDYSSISLGIAFIIISLLCRYGAEVIAPAARNIETPAQDNNGGAQ